MQIDIITNTLAQKVIDTIYDEWHHEGHIQVEHTDDFYFTLDGKLYCVQVREVDKIVNRQQAEIEELTVDCEKYKAERDEFANHLGRIREMAQAEAIKEFAERLKEYYSDFDELHEEIRHDNLIYAIDDLVKEMTEEKQNG